MGCIREMMPGKFGLNACTGIWVSVRTCSAWRSFNFGTWIELCPGFGNQGEKAGALPRKGETALL